MCLIHFLSPVPCSTQYMSGFTKQINGGSINKLVFLEDIKAWYEAYFSQRHLFYFFASSIHCLFSSLFFRLDRRQWISCSIVLSLLPACAPKMICPREHKAVALFCVHPCPEHPFSHCLGKELWGDSVETQVSINRQITLAVILKSLANTGFKRPVERVVMDV